MDTFTRKNILYLLPHFLSAAQKEQVFDDISKEINLVGESAWNFTQVLR